MVLQPNFAKLANSENTPPHLINGKALNSQTRSTLQEASRRRRARANGVPRTSKNMVEIAKKRSTVKTPASTLRFKMDSRPVDSDVEMKDAPVTQITRVTLPRYLGRPDFREISREALLAADFDNPDMSLPFIRSGLQEHGASMLKVLGSVRTAPLQTTLPTEVPIVIHDVSGPPPTHMMAIYGPPSSASPTEKRKITLYPVHSGILAAYCAKLPPFRPTAEAIVSAGPEQVVREATIPIRPICLPSPQTYPQLSSFLYTKRADALLASLLPCLPPRSLSLENQEEINAFSTNLARTYTIYALFQHAMTIHGLWSNMCALGIFDDSLWDTINLAWQVLLTAIAISTGNPQEMIPTA